MGNKIEEYLKEYSDEKVELIVRINWSWKRGKSKFDKIGNYYKAYARFDKAINVKTGELMEAEWGCYEIGWLAPRKIFGYKYGYKFKKGCTYRILARKKISKKDALVRMFYLEQVLEEDTKEPRLDLLYEFENKYEEKVTDLTVLVKKRIHAWKVKLNYRVPEATFIASINNETNELSQSYGTLTWMEEDRKSNIKFNFDALEAYRVKVRKSKENDDSYLLLDVLKKVKEDRFENIKEEYLKPVVIRNELGEFRLDKDFNCFEGQVDYFGGKCSVQMKVKEGETTLDIQFSILNKIVRNLETWDHDATESVLNELLESANEYSEDEDEIIKEQFIKRIGVPTIGIDTSGEAEIWFDDDDMFGGHSIVIYSDGNGDFVRADLVG